MKNILKSLFLLILVLATSVFFLACVQPDTESETTPESVSAPESVSESDPEEPFDGESNFDVELPEVDRM